MFTSLWPELRPARFALAALVWGAAPLAAQQVPSPNSTAASGSTFTGVVRSESPELKDVSPAHPLTSVIEYARKEQAYLRQTVRDFKCQLVKRERIEGFLQDYQYIDLAVREEVRDDDRIVSPLSIYMQFLAPARVAGRRVLYIDGRNDGKMLVRNGGKHFDYVVAKIDPFGDSAKDESLVPITQTGFNQILGQMISVLGRHAEADPTGSNTKVERIPKAKLNGRECTVIRITHAKQQPGLEFHIANVFVDRQLHIPARVDYSDWPKRANQPSPLIAEYTYTKLQVNLGLNDRSFDERLLRTNR